MNAADFALRGTIESDPFAPEMMEDLGLGITFYSIIGFHCWKVLFPEVEGPRNPGRRHHIKCPVRVQKTRAVA